MVKILHQTITYALFGASLILPSSANAMDSLGLTPGEREQSIRLQREFDVRNKDKTHQEKKLSDPIMFSSYERKQALKAQLTFEIEREYQTFRGARIPSLTSQLCKVVQFIYHLQGKKGDAYTAQKIAMIIGNGTGVGGIDLHRTATDDEKKVIFDCLHKSVKRGAAFSDFQLSSRATDSVIGQHQRVVEMAVTVINTREEWGVNQSFNFINDSLYDSFKQIVLADSTPTRSMPRVNEIARNPNYGGMFPNAPVLHFYDAQANPGFFSLTQQLPFSEYKRQLPENVKSCINSIADEGIDLFFISQYRLFKQRDTGDTLFRAHYWVSPNGHPWNSYVTASFLRANRGLTLLQDKILYTQGVNVHDGISSPNNFSVEDLLPKKDESISFWILVHNPITNRYALTLYWYLQWQDHDYLSAFKGDFKNLKGYLTHQPSKSLNRLCFPF